MKQEMMGWQWHQLDHMQIICTSLQTDDHASNSSLNFFTGRVLFVILPLPLPPPTAFFQDNLGKLAPERQTILDTGARDEGVAVASAGPCANDLHLTPD